MKHIMILIDKKNSQLRSAVEYIFDNENGEYTCDFVAEQQEMDEHLSNINLKKHDIIIIIKDLMDLEQSCLFYSGKGNNIWLVPLCINNSETDTIRKWKNENDRIINIYEYCDSNFSMCIQEKEFCLYVARYIYSIIMEEIWLESRKTFVCPKMSVITVCYNAEQTIEKALKSVIEQKYPNKEIVIIDGASTDGTTQIIDEYRDYISVFISEKDKGIFDAMNKGIKNASGDVISFLNSDDWMEPGAMSAVAAKFMEKNSDAVIGDSYAILQDKSRVYYDGDENGDNDIRVRMPYHHEAIFARQNMFNKEENFDTKYKLAADYDWFLRKYIDGMSIARIHIPVFTFTYGGVSSVNSIECGFEAKKISTNYTNDIEILKQIKERWKNVVKGSLSVKLVETIKDSFWVECSNLDREKDVYIWGTGLWAKRNAEILLAIFDNVRGFVDNDVSKRDKFFAGQRVFLCKDISKDSSIIIATPRYGGEIKMQLLKEGWEINQIIMADSIIEKLAELVLDKWS